MSSSNVEIIEGLIASILGIQIVYGLSILILGRTMVDYYEWGTFRKPETGFQKIVNFFSAAIFGSSYYIYKRLERFKWWKRKLYLLLILILMSIASIILFYTVSYILRSILL